MDKKVYFQKPYRMSAQYLFQKFESVYPM